MLVVQRRVKTLKVDPMPIMVDAIGGQLLGVEVVTLVLRGEAYLVVLSLVYCIVKLASLCLLVLFKVVRRYLPTW